jgi:hypothetical protein
MQGAKKKGANAAAKSDSSSLDLSFFALPFLAMSEKFP